MTTPAVSARSSRIPEPPSAATPTPTPTTPRPTAELSAPSYEDVFAANARVPDLSRMVVQGAAGSTAAAGPAVKPTALATLDALEAELSGPYTITGQSAAVSAPPTFHSNYSQQERLERRPELLAFARRACARCLRALDNACGGRPTARELVQVTQALLDAGALGGKTSIVAQDIRDLQARFRIGIDCIGFVRIAQIALHGKSLGKTNPGDGCLSWLDGAHGYARKPGGLDGIAGAQAGDVVHLEPSRQTENRQHNMVVRRNETLDLADPRCRGLAGPVHLVELVSAGGGDDSIRGVRRETWVYDASSKCFADASTNPLSFAPALDGHERGMIFTRRAGAR